MTDEEQTITIPLYVAKWASGWLMNGGVSGPAAALQKAIGEQTYTRPDEPTNLGAVVVDANGAAWVRWHSGVLYGDWLRLQDGKYRAAGAIWEGIERPRVVHHGWDGSDE